MSERGLDEVRERVIELLDLTKIPYTFAFSRDESYLECDPVGDPLYFGLCPPDDEIQILEILHELGHFIDWPKLRNPMIQRAYKRRETEPLTRSEWHTLLSSEIRAWRNAVDICHEEDFQFSVASWDYHITGETGLSSYYNLWERFYDVPPMRANGAMNRLFAVVYRASADPIRKEVI